MARKKYVQMREEGKPPSIEQPQVGLLPFFLVSSFKPILSGLPSLRPAGEP